MYEILLVIYLLAALAVIGLVLVQQGKGADMGASFGAGASNTVFGAGGSGNFLTRMTAVSATVFFIISLALGNLSTNHGDVESGWENLTQPATTQSVEKTAETPAAPAAPNSDIPQ
ncbi:preprotein translocase subunit SecG [Vibrio sp. SS-MA-C1-2]|uniref:preprotein translocase subunit SecG n=1 Tax=Vibrio sp. SS-MA-C1-2 TaxID=2908646 RepID=UPI001F30CCCD|nr:preprotein translocase subunit SecG [Vibrio sp. SS-MA-C1-2]UJF19696.1 preprotein translocase subunit SecG [Vibrio sp. SS-MA-C1-2]